MGDELMSDFSEFPSINTPAPIADDSFLLPEGPLDVYQLVHSWDEEAPEVKISEAQLERDYP